ncbi:hypothetical protein RHMOL_Rhmol03G0160000 [Rhododendron molle]|uniref:Uncharacterized protein n=1 Tax=Rhododendron molle TaxID=49168 RepID=A0ACC0PG76_RHOML|nr:hypothetical protein RHMOL_Rhmol03G0160000 [Rhododendron molle]
MQPIDSSHNTPPWLETTALTAVVELQLLAVYCKQQHRGRPPLRREIPTTSPVG